MDFSALWRKKNKRITNGLPESFIRQAIKAKELKAQKIGRGLKVSRKTLDNWVGLIETKLESST